MVALSVINNCDAGRSVWVEVHNVNDIRPVVKAVNPSGPYAAKRDQSQPVGDFRAAKEGFTAFLFADSKPGTESFERVDVKKPPATIVLAADRQLVRVIQRDDDPYRPAPRLPLWLRWTVFGLGAAAMLAAIAFILYKVITKWRNNNVSRASVGLGE